MLDKQKLANDLRALAEQVEAGESEINSTLTLHHGVPQVDPSGVVRDSRYVGFTLILSTWPYLPQKQLSDLLDPHVTEPHQFAVRTNSAGG